MKRLITFLLLVLISLTGLPQPGGYVPGDLTCWTFNGREHLYFSAVGWNASTDHVLIFFGGDGQEDCITGDDMEPGRILANDGQNWNGITTLPNATTRRWKVIFIMDDGQQPAIYKADIEAFLNSTGLSLPTQKGQVHIGGGSLGPGNAYGWLNTTSSNVYRTYISTGIWMSTTFLFADASWPVPRNYCWYGAGDTNPGTPPSATQGFYSTLPGTANVDKRMKFTTLPGNNHNNITWGDCFSTAGTDSITNRWIWMIIAGEALTGAPNNPPSVNAGNDQTITLPTSATTLSGTATDNDGTITGYQWTRISGPNIPTILTPTSQTTTVTGLIAGVYVFRLTATDNNSATGSDDVQVVVSATSPSTHQITIVPGRDVWNWMGKKAPENLFDGDLNTKIDMEGFVNNQFATPFKFFVSLGDSCWRNLRIKYYHGFGSSSWTVNCYDSSKTLRGSFGFSGVFSAEATMPGNPDTMLTPIRFIEFIASSPASDVRELYIYGDKVAKCSPVVPARAVYQKTDPGIIQGGSALGDKDTNYLKRPSDNVSIYSGFRCPNNQFYFTYDPGSPYLLQPIRFDQFGQNIDQLKLSFYKIRGVPVQFYINGSSLLTIPGLTAGSTYNQKTETNKLKDIPPGSDSILYSNWGNTGRTWKVMAHLYGNNPASVLGPSYTVSGTGLTPGQDKIKYFEIGNEDDKNWFGTQGYHSPEVELTKLKMAWDSIKAVDPEARVFTGACLQLDTIYLRGMYFVHYWKYNSTDFPANGINFNQYISSAYGGQPQGGTAYQAVSPEQFKVTEMCNGIGEFVNRIFGPLEVHWTEIGFAVGAGNYKVNAVTGIPDSVVQGAMMLRVLERVSMAPNGISEVYNYFHVSDGGGDFAGMYMVRENFSEDGFSQYLGSTRRPMWWMYSMRMNALKDYKGWNTIVTNGDSTGVSVAKYTHKTDPNKSVYYVGRGTYNGSTSTNYVVNVGPGVASVDLITYTYGQENGTITPLTVTGNTVTIPTVNEIPQYLRVTLGSAPLPHIRIRRNRWILKP